MKYKLRKQFTTNSVEALNEILIDRGVKNIMLFRNPSKVCELNPYDLENIKNAAEMLLSHLRKDHRCLFIVDCD